MTRTLPATPLANWLTRTARRAALRRQAGFASAVFGPGRRAYLGYRLRGFITLELLRFVSEVLQYAVFVRTFAIKFQVPSLLVLALADLGQAAWNGMLESWREVVRREADKQRVRALTQRAYAIGVLLAASLSAACILWLIAGAQSEEPRNQVFAVIGAALGFRLALGVWLRSLLLSLSAKSRLAVPLWASTIFELLPFFLALALFPLIYDFAFPVAVVAATALRTYVSFRVAQRMARESQQTLPTFRLSALRHGEHFKSRPVSTSLSFVAQRVGALVTISLLFSGNGGIFPIVAHVVSPLLNATAVWTNSMLLDVYRSLRRTTMPLAASLLRGTFAATILLSTSSWAVSFVAIRLVFPRSLIPFGLSLAPLFLAKGIFGFGIFVRLARRNFLFTATCGVAIAVLMALLTMYFPDMDEGPRLAILSATLLILGCAMAQPAFGRATRLAQRSGLADGSALSFASAVTKTPTPLLRVDLHPTPASARLLRSWRQRFAARAHLSPHGREQLWIACIDQAEATQLKASMIKDGVGLVAATRIVMPSPDDFLQRLGVFSLEAKIRDQVWSKTSVLCPGVERWRCGMADHLPTSDPERLASLLRAAQQASDGGKTRVRPGLGAEPLFVFDGDGLAEILLIPASASNEARTALKAAYAGIAAS